MDESKVQPESYLPLQEGRHHLRIRDLFILSLRVFKVRTLRTFLTIFGISLGIGTVLFLVSLGYGLQYILIGKLAATEDSLITLETYYPSESNLNMTQNDVDAISAIPETGEVSPVAEFSGEEDMGNLTGFIVAKTVRANYFRLSGINPDTGVVFSEGDKSVLLSNTALRLLGMKEDATSLGKEINLKVFYQDQSNATTTRVSTVPYPLKIVGIVNDETQPPFVLAPVEVVPDPPPYFTRVFTKAKDINTVETLRDKLIAKGYLISAKIDLVNQAKRIMNVITIILGVFGVTALVVSAIGMFNTMIIGFLERIFEVGIMKSIGATVSDIRNLFLMESLIMGLAGGVGGIVVGVTAGQVFNIGLNFLARYLGGKPVNLFIYPIQFIIFIIIISGLVGIMSGFWPARRAGQLSPREAFKNK